MSGGRAVFGKGGSGDATALLNATVRQTLDELLLTPGARNGEYRLLNGRLYYWDASNTATDDGLWTRLPNGQQPATPGRWVINREGGYTISIEWFKGLNNTPDDWSAGIQAAVNLAGTLGNATVMVPQGEYRYSQTILLARRVCVKGSGALTSTLRYTGSGDAILSRAPRTGGTDAAPIYGKIFKTEFSDLAIRHTGNAQRGLVLHNNSEYALSRVYFNGFPIHLALEGTDIGSARLCDFADGGIGADFTVGTAEPYTYSCGNGTTFSGNNFWDNDVAHVRLRANAVMLRFVDEWMEQAPVHFLIQNDVTTNINTLILRGVTCLGSGSTDARMIKVAPSSSLQLNLTAVLEDVRFSASSGGATSSQYAIEISDKFNGSTITANPQSHNIVLSRTQLIGVTAGGVMSDSTKTRVDWQPGLVGAVAGGTKPVNAPSSLASVTFGDVQGGVGIRQVTSVADQYRLIATLPATGGGTYDKLLVELIGGNYGSADLASDRVVFGNRDAFNYSYRREGPGTRNAAIVAYRQADGSVQVYHWTKANTYTASIVQAVGIGFDAVGVLTTFAPGLPTSTVPSGTLVFDSFNVATYPPNTPMTFGALTATAAIVGGKAVVRDEVPFKRNYRSTTADTAVTTADDIVGVNVPSGGAVTITLPTAAVGYHYTFTIKRTDNGTGTLTLAAQAGDNIDSAATRLIAGRECVRVYSAGGTSWVVI